MKFLNNITLDKLSRLIGKNFQLNTDNIYNKYYHNGKCLFVIGPTDYISICDIKILEILNRNKVNCNYEMIEISNLILKNFTYFSYHSLNIKLNKIFYDSIFEENSKFYLKNNKRYFNAYLNKLFHIKDLEHNHLYIAPEIHLAIEDNQINITQHQDINIIAISLSNKSSHIFKEFDKSSIKEELPEFLFNFFSSPILNINYSDYCKNKKSYLKLLKILNI
ncbi:MAG: hypothetical protein K2X69_14860 [Silvanigrellaceae bacterium]|nr:hypothetical protein [Silvanigrellaceae bacterium]